MKAGPRAAGVVALLLLGIARLSRSEDAGSVDAGPENVSSACASNVHPPGSGVLLDGVHSRGPSLSTSAAGDSCGDALLDLAGDQGYENAISWQFEGVLAPDLGAFAQIYPAGRILCGIVLDLTQNGAQSTQRMDLYVWENASGMPGAVRSLVIAVEPGPVAPWPEIGRHFLALPETACAEVDSIWIGYWPSWVGERAGWYVGADLDGPAARPVTRIAPGLGFPTGWQDVSKAWGPVAALGIGLSVVPCVPDPVITSSWGSIKSLFR